MSAGVIAAHYAPQLDTWNPATMLGADNIHPNDAGMTYLADSYQEALAGAGITSLAGVAVVAYGDSWTSTDTQNTPGQRAIQQLINRLGGTLYNWAESGHKVGDQAVRSIVGSGAWPAGTDGLAVIAGLGLNNLGQTDDATARAAVETGLRSMFAVISAAQRIEQSSFSYSAGWGASNGALAEASGGTNAWSSTNAVTATYNITTAGTYYLLVQVADGSSLVGGKLTISQGGTTLAEFDINGKHVNTGYVLTGGYGPGAVRLGAVQTGTLTITYSTNGRAGTVYGFLDALIRINPTPPKILAVKPVRTPNYTAYNKPDFLAYIRGQYDVMAAEFGANVVVCDPDPAAG